jgi:uncharacterized phage-like protein YoqJ
MNKKRKLDEFNSSDLKKYIKENPNESAKQLLDKNEEYIDPTLNLV